MALNPLISLEFKQPVFDNPLDNYGKLARLRYLNEPRTRAVREALTPAQSARLAEQKTQWTKDRHHKEAVGLARGFLSLPEDIFPRIYPSMRQKAIDLGHPNAAQLPEQWTPELLPVLKMLASGMPAEELKAGGKRVDPAVYDVNADLEGGTDSDMVQRYGGDGGPGGKLGDPLPGPKRSTVRRGKDRRR